MTYTRVYATFCTFFRFSLLYPPMHGDLVNNVCLFPRIVCGLSFVYQPGILFRFYYLPLFPSFIVPDGIRLPSLQGGLGSFFSFLPRCPVPAIFVSGILRLAYERDTGRQREPNPTSFPSPVKPSPQERVWGEVLYPPITGINRSGHITVLALPSASLLEVDSQSDHQQRSLSFLLLQGNRMVILIFVNQPGIICRFYFPYVHYPALYAVLIFRMSIFRHCMPFFFRLRLLARHYAVF